MNQYEELKARIIEKVKAADPKDETVGYSKADLVALAQTALNTPEHEETIVVASKEGKPEFVHLQPVEKYRKSLETVLVSSGLDKEDAKRIETAALPKSHAEALLDVAEMVQQDYLDTGRKLNFPMRREDQASWSIQRRHAEERVRPGRRMEKKEDGTYISVETGEMLATKKHDALKSSNKVPDWLKEKM